VKIAIFEIEGWEREAVASLGDEHEVVYRDDRLTERTAAEVADADIVSTFIYSDLGRAVLERLRSLRLVATRSTGFDHIDMGFCAERGIDVANVPTYGENTVAEHVFALLGALSHNIVEAADRTRRGDFSQQGLQGFDLQGRVFGVVGTGEIGTCVARIARGYGMEVIAHDVAPDPERAERTGFRYVGFHELLGQADIISLHVPLNDHTKKLLSHDEFGRMKQGAILINTARGALVDVDALLRALTTGKVAAAGLDVLPEEPALREEAELLRRWYRHEHDLETLLADHILLRLRNVIITPHSAFNTREAVGRILATTRENISGWLAGKPVNLVTAGGSR
jgi:D-lactate dehydrogenase